MLYLITGGAGFVGSHLADALVARGHDVVALDDLSSGHRENLEPAVATGKASLVEASVLDRDVLEPLMREVDGCFHLAATVGVKAVVAHPLHVMTTDIAATDLVMRTAAQHETRLLFASSSEVYGKRSGTLDELDELAIGNPSRSRWSYAIAKLHGEALANGLQVERGADMTVVRLFNAVGTRQTAAYGMVLPRFVQQALRGDALTVYGDGSQSRCFTNVRDTVRALMELMTRGCGGGPFNVGARTAVSVADLARRVIDVTGSRSRIELVPYATAYGPGFDELGTRIPDISRLREATGWEPALTVGQTIDEIVWHELGRRCDRAAGRAEEALAEVA